MNHVIITNATKNAQLPETVEAGKAITIQLAPEGKYPQIVDDDSAEGGQREVVQVLDRQAMDALVANFEKSRAEAEAKGQKYGVLVDADHSSETSTNTAAMGWVTKLYVDPEKGLMAEIEPTTLGAEKINGKVYRFVSGAWTLDDDDRPVELVSIGLTNKPNLPVAPMTNAAKAAKDDDSGTPPTGEGVTNTDGKDAANADGTAKKDADGNAGTPKPEGDGIITNKETEDMNEIKTLLGLPEEATEEDIAAAVSALVERCNGMEQVTNALGLDETATNEEILEAVNAVVNQCGDLQAQNEEIEKEKLEGEAETLVADNEDVLPEEIREEIKEEYIEDPEKAKETVANYRRIYDRAVRNSATAIRNAKFKVGDVVSVKREAAEMIDNPALARKRGRVTKVLPGGYYEVDGELGATGLELTDRELVLVNSGVRTAVVFRNSEARRPSVGIAGIVASCGGDPVAINAEIAKMYKH